MCEAEDRDHDLPLALEWEADATTQLLVPLDVLFRDGFAIGTYGNWSAHLP